MRVLCYRARTRPNRRQEQSVGSDRDFLFASAYAAFRLRSDPRTAATELTDAIEQYVDSRVRAGLREARPPALPRPTLPRVRFGGLLSVISEGAGPCQAPRPAGLIFLRCSPLLLGATPSAHAVRSGEELRSVGGAGAAPGRSVAGVALHRFSFSGTESGWGCRSSLRRARRAAWSAATVVLDGVNQAGDHAGRGGHDYWRPRVEHRPCSLVTPRIA